jgi:hypothetical protein
VSLVNFAIEEHTLGVTSPNIDSIVVYMGLNFLISGHTVLVFTTFALANLHLIGVF